MILWHAFAGAVPQPEVVLRIGIPLLGLRPHLGDRFLLLGDRRSACCNENGDREVAQGKGFEPDDGLVPGDDGLECLSLLIGFRAKRAQPSRRKAR